jgi:hypothetical protein
MTIKFTQVINNADMEKSSDISLMMVAEFSETRFGPKFIGLVAQQDFIDDMQTKLILN